jgi:hypothetical protein
MPKRSVRRVTGMDLKDKITYAIVAAIVLAFVFMGVFL